MAKSHPDPVRRVQKTHLDRWRRIAGRPPYVYLLLNEITLRSLAAGHLTPRLQSQAKELAANLDATLKVKDDHA